MGPYSHDLRERIVAAVDRGEHSLRELAHLFSVSLSCIVRLLQRRRTGTIDPKPHAGGRTPRLDAAALQRLRALVAEHPDATLAELRALLEIPCHIATIGRALARLGITRKKKTLHADERDTPRVQAKRAEFEQRMAAVDPHHLVFVDETGATTALTRTYGWAPVGERVEGSVPGRWQTVTLITGLRLDGVVAPLAYEGPTDTPVFQTYVQEVLAPQLHRGDVVVWDNLRVHENAEAIAAIEAVGARVEPLPPYSPDETPIEEMYGKVKGHLRTLVGRTVGGVIDAMGESLHLITPSDILGWFRHRCAYAFH
jgi:transposase